MPSIAPLAASAATAPGFTPGSPNVAVADPVVPRPPGRACVVPLFNGFQFTDFSNHPYTYAPPTGCGRAWSKVVLEADFNVTAGRQFDRTASFWLGGANIYFGTTQEPSATVAPSWHVERDVSDFASLLANPQTGQAILGNIVDGTYTGVISGSARLVFYPANVLAPKVDAPDAVYPLSDGTAGGPVALNTGTDTLSRTFTLPTNVERAYLDVFAQGQGGDEFWYSCVPNDFAGELQSCGGGSYRETQVSIDGQAAGVAPVYPWIFTGGIDPYMWRPTPGVQTLNFVPYRVDLTPFAALLNDGAPHTVAVTVTGANGYFSVTGNLFVYQDHGKKKLTGAVTTNTLQGQAPNATIGSTVTDVDGVVGGGVTTKASRTFRTAGYVDTSHGRITTDVSQTVTFANTQDFTIDATQYVQAIDQRTTVDSTTKTRQGPFGIGTTNTVAYDFPLTAKFAYTFDTDGNILTSPSQVTQGFTRHFTKKLGALTLYRSDVDNHISTSDTLAFTNNAVTGHSNQASTQQFRFSDNLGSCYGRDVVTTTGTLTSATDGAGCSGGRNRLLWFTHPDGSSDTSRTEDPGTW
ncbi:peptide-N(4)-(N-acetyl-beta-glucosaminyl)asparagine amidase [Luteibacter yeojuensis]|uniref:Peptide-N(4)-(N-acetyl-beta-glucosaminyl)asparagine amidase n=1 Tax=Luteibacter yeojuensis TaxID=345309 RepID=A0A0F3L4W1_9GAMM|nr:peptide-N(4)-(N-acetyl-beta-glucosaminyl)asparagine amidase [Luteibacter yeojuensis]